MKDLNQHIKEEENDDLPELESALQKDESESIAKSVTAQDSTAPIRGMWECVRATDCTILIGLVLRIQKR